MIKQCTILKEFADISVCAKPSADRHFLHLLKTFGGQVFSPSAQRLSQTNIFHFPFHITSIFHILFLIVFLQGCNPFAPAIDESSSDSSTLSDLSTVDGIFKNFQYSYTFKDTIIYGQLISNDFIFSFRNFEGDQVFDDSWGREEDMRATYGLFQNVQRLDLIWNNIILSTQDSSTATIVRGFNLTITFNPTDIQRIDGRVNMSMRKNSSTNKWEIIRWIDESNF